MPKANSYRAERMLGPYGFSITDCLTVDGNRKKPVTFSKIGDQIDLNHVDIKSMVKSAVSGQINRLLVGGALSTVQQEVSEDREREIQMALSEFGLSNYNDHPMAAPVKYVTLEPGVMVAVSIAPEKPKDVQIIEPEPLPMTAQLEPGLMAPTGAAGGQNAEAIDAPPASEAPTTKTKKKSSKKADGLPAEKANPYLEWKFNMDFQTQKRTIVESTDLEFLKWVAVNDDTIQFQKLAQTRLAEGEK